MATEKVLYAVRIPVDLKRLLNSAAASGGVNTSQLVIAACWKYLERGSSVAEHTADVVPRSREVAGSVPATKPQHSEQVKAALRAVCEGNHEAIAKSHQAQVQHEAVSESVQGKALPLCVVCESPMREIKGKWACADPSCAKYGLEQKIPAPRAKTERVALRNG